MMDCQWVKIYLLVAKWGVFVCAVWSDEVGLMWTYSLSGGFMLGIGGEVEGYLCDTSFGFFIVVCWWWVEAGVGGLSLVVLGDLVLARGFVEGRTAGGVVMVVLCWGCICIRVFAGNEAFTWCACAESFFEIFCAWNKSQYVRSCFKMRGGGIYLPQLTFLR